MAGELTIAPNTIVKAYNELQKMGLIDSRPGVGTVVASDLDSTLRRHQIEALFERLRALVRDAAGLGISEEELLTRFDAEVARFYREQKSTEEGG